jgi:UDP-2,3-diacylglucosamine pyrophosphatase LpxH
MKRCATAVALGLIAAGIAWASDCGSSWWGVGPAQASGPAGSRGVRDAGDAWSFAVLSDIHVSRKSEVAPAFGQVVKELVALKPRLVVIVGDSTNGNPGDTYDLETIRSWWRALDGALAPLREAGIAVFSVAGNHDSYRAEHRQGYEEAWGGMPAQVAPIELAGAPPHNYSFSFGDVHFSLLRVTDQSLDAEARAWIRRSLASPEARNARLRLAFGHVPLKSVMGRSNPRFEQDLGSELLAGGVDAYVAGHEHLFWDEELRIGDRRLRQLTVGTASATYTFPLNERTYNAHCAGARCVLPASGQPFALDPGTRQQRSKVTLLWVTVGQAAGGSGRGYEAQFLALNEAGRLQKVSGYFW